MTDWRFPLYASARMAHAFAYAVAARAGDVVRGELDDYAFSWLMSRRGLERRRAAELLERLGDELGAKIELDAPL